VGEAADLVHLAAAVVLESGALGAATVPMRPFSLVRTGAVL